MQTISLLVFVRNWVYCIGWIIFSELFSLLISRTRKRHFQNLKQLHVYAVVECRWDQFKNVSHYNYINLHLTLSRFKKSSCHWLAPFRITMTCTRTWLSLHQNWQIRYWSPVFFTDLLLYFHFICIILFSTLYINIECTVHAKLGKNTYGITY